MNDYKTLLEKHQIYEYGVIDFNKVKILNPKLLPAENIKSALFILIPYRTGNLAIKDSFNMGLFARIRDYHGYFAELSKKLIPELQRISGGDVFGFADHSPVDEKDGARQCGLGFIGKNSLLINPRYGSFVFIGCFLFTERLEEKNKACLLKCGTCTACAKACPCSAVCDGKINRTLCLSAISQKKNKSNEEKALIKSSKTVWGCDICQNTCPYNKNAELSPISDFDFGVLDNISAEIIENMDDDTYKGYAFSFRQKKVITENFLTD